MIERSGVTIRCLGKDVPWADATDCEVVSFMSVS